MTPYIQPSNEQKEEFKIALDVFKQTQGENLQYQELLKNNPNLQDYFKDLIKKYIFYFEHDYIDLLLSKDQEVSKIKIVDQSILRNLIKFFQGDRSVAIISNHISKFTSIKDDKDNDNNNLIASLLDGDDN